MEKLSYRKIITVASMLFGMFFWSGKSDFPCLHGPACRTEYVAGVGRIPDHRSRSAASWRGRSGHQPRKRPAGACQPGRKKVRTLFYLCALSDHRPVFCHPEMRHCFLHGGNRAHSAGNGTVPGTGSIFSALLRSRSFLFPLRPGEILTWIGKVLNPLFLVFLAILIHRALTAPMGEISAVDPQGAYLTGAFATGLLEGYNTMDALAGLAFGIIVVDVIRSLGITEPGAVAKNTVRAGIFQLSSDGSDLCSCHCGGSSEPRNVCGRRQRRGGSRADRAALFWKRRRSYSGSHCHNRLPENSSGLNYQLRGNLCKHIPKWSFLPGMGPSCSACCPSSSPIWD